MKLKSIHGKLNNLPQPQPKIKLIQKYVKVGLGGGQDTAPNVNGVGLGIMHADPKKYGILGLK